MSNKDMLHLEKMVSAYSAAHDEYKRIIEQPGYINSATLKPHVEMMSAMIDLASAARSEVPVLISTLRQFRDAAMHVLDSEGGSEDEVIAFRELRTALMKVTP